MRKLLLDVPAPTILCLGAHSDDIEIGAGATVLQMLAGSPRASLHWHVFSGARERADEARRSADLFGGGSLVSFSVHSFRDGFFPASFEDLKEAFRTIRDAVEPDLVFTHWRGDLHQDHRLIAELTRQTFRNHLILEYEILKYDGDLSPPNLYMPIDEVYADQKIANLLTAFPSQRAKYWFRDETLRSFMRVRGVECRSSYAEAFYGHKVLLGQSK